MNRRALLASAAALLAAPVPAPRVAAESAARALAEASDGHLWLVVVDADGPILRRRQGYARDEPVPLGSVRKWLTAALAMTAVDRGEVDLDAPIGRWLPAWDRPDRAGVTLRRLLSHTAGLKRRPRDGFCRGLGTLAACVDKMVEAPPADPPGEAFRYSSAGFHVAARVLEVAGSAPYPALLRDRLLDPLEMSGTELRPAGPELEEMTGEIWSTPPELSHFLQMLVAGGSFRGRQVLSAAAVATLEAGQVAGVRWVPGVPKRRWWPDGFDHYALGCWRNAEDDEGRTAVVTTEGKSGGREWLVGWLDRRAGRAGCAALRAPRRARAPFRALVEATCGWAGADGCATTWGVGEAGDDE